MPRLHLPRVKLSFLKKLVSKTSRREAVSEPTVEISSKEQRDKNDKNQQDEQEAAQEPPLEECPICHDPVGVPNPEGILESWVHLHCNHKFGTQCIQTWLKESAERDPHATPSCPICRSAAKHPCGHPIVLPAQRFSPFSGMWAPVPPSMPRPYLPQLQGTRARRRLSRRMSHPHRPQLPPPVRAHVQTVGECTACAAIASAQEKMKELAASSAEAESSNSGGRGRNSDRRTEIKSMVMSTNLRRLSSASMEHMRTGNHRASTDVSSESSGPITSAPSGLRDHTNLCRPEATVARSPTPTPALYQVLSF
ncbi:hypothetical protein F5Y14DRAFT_453498 [Nemania sp. NC0429]|nr:hypothetical protein F5Y14DRAFT_453498 [Nemania sp. NC0429]